MTGAGSRLRRIAAAQRPSEPRLESWVPSRLNRLPSPRVLDFAPLVGATMILPRYHIGASAIPGAGKGVFIDDPVPRGTVLIAPDAIPRTWSFEEVNALPNASELLPATVRWFENRYTISDDWPDECFVNHSFVPTGLWHLGFIFASAPLPAGTEITVDYRHLLAPGQEEDFRDAQSGKRIVGYNWNESLRMSSQALLELLA